MILHARIVWKLKSSKLQSGPPPRRAADRACVAARGAARWPRGAGLARAPRALLRLLPLAQQLAGLCFSVAARRLFALAPPLGLVLGVRSSSFQLCRSCLNRTWYLLEAACTTRAKRRRDHPFSASSNQARATFMDRAEPSSQQRLWVQIAERSRATHRFHRQASRKVYRI